MHGREAVNLDGLTAVLLRVFLSPKFYIQDETRALEPWLAAVGTAAQEVELLSSKYPGVVDALPLISADLSFASEQWLLGDPEQPPTAHALNAIEHILFTHRLSSRPPAPKLPTTLCRVSTNTPDI